MILNEANIKRFIKSEIMRHLNIILTAQAGDNSGIETETIENLFPGSPSIPERPVMHPYGFVSRAPAKTLSVVAKHGADPSNRMVLGHRDSGRPTDLDSGEACLYSADGNKIKIGKGVELLNDNGSFKIDADGNMIYTAGSTEAKISTGGTFSVTNTTAELTATIVKMFDLISKATVPTMLGPQTIVMPEEFPVEYAKLETFQE